MAAQGRTRPLRVRSVSNIKLTHGSRVMQLMRESFLPCHLCLAGITDSSDLESSGKEGRRIPTLAPVQVPPRNARFLFPTSGSYSSPRSAHVDASIPGSPSSAQQRMQAPQVCEDIFRRLRIPQVCKDVMLCYCWTDVVLTGYRKNGSFFSSPQSAHVGARIPGSPSRASIVPPFQAVHPVHCTLHAQGSRCSVQCLIHTSHVPRRF